MSYNVFGGTLNPTLLLLPPHTPVHLFHQHHCRHSLLLLFAISESKHALSSFHKSNPSQIPGGWVYQPIVLPSSTAQRFSVSVSCCWHVTEVIRSCNYHIRALRHIRPLLTLDVANMIGHSIVASRLDYANALLHGTSAGNLDRLQVTQNSLARTVLQAPYSVSATELRQQLHWLPIRQRIIYKLAVITYKTRSTS